MENKGKATNKQMIIMIIIVVIILMTTFGISFEWQSILFPILADV